MQINKNFGFSFIFLLGSFFSCIIPADEFGPGPVQPANQSPPQTKTAQFTGIPRKLNEQ